jgi:hypothetical protein
MSDDEGVTYEPMTKEEVQEAIEDALELKTDMGREIVKVALECIKLFDDKQQDYGSMNILMSGELGVACRLLDKASRVRHILVKQLKGDAKINYESLEDAYIDVANIGMIGMLLNRKVWK